MQQALTRRCVLATLSSAAAMSLIGGANGLAQEAPPETSTIRLIRNAGICIAPQYVADELLRAEGFTDIQHLMRSPAFMSQAIGRGEVDLSLHFAASIIPAIDAGEAITVLAGVHVGCFELFANEQVHSIRDLKGKKVGIQGLGTQQHAFLTAMAAYVGLDPLKDIDWVMNPTAAELFVEGKIDAFLGFPPEPQELRAKQIGRVIFDTAVDRPWSQYFCCMLAGNREFIRRHPVATKRAMRAILKATDLCASEPARAARLLVDGGFTPSYDYALQTLKDVPYDRWREYDAEDTIRFYALRMRDAGFIKSTPQKIITENTDWRFLDELKRDLKA